jgi:aminopeptidase N
VNIDHTGDAVSAFDHISYRKGASVVKTLENMIGRAKLKKGIQNYIQKFKYKNAELDDFIYCLDEA